MIGNDEPVASQPGQVVAKGDWYDFESKYEAGGMELIVPAPISDTQIERVRRIAVDCVPGGARPTAWRASISSSPTRARCCSTS